MTIQMTLQQWSEMHHVVVLDHKSHLSIDMKVVQAFDVNPEFFNLSDYKHGLILEQLKHFFY